MAAAEINNAESGRGGFLFRAPGGLPADLEPNTPLRYGDVGLFFISVLLLALAFWLQGA